MFHSKMDSAFKCYATSLIHFAAFIQDPAILVVWDDDPNHLLVRAQGLEDQLMAMIWKVEEEDNEKANTVILSKTASRTPSIHIKELLGSQESLAEPRRKIVLIQPLLTAITFVLIFAAMGSGWRQIAVELKVDKNWVRLAFVAVVPLQIWLALVSSVPLQCSHWEAHIASSSCNPSLAASRRSWAPSAK
jgi:hypothetical protein